MRVSCDRSMRAQRAFTLVELIVVIVLLGILGVTAMGRFADLSADARAAALQGVSGAIHSFDIQVFAKAAVLGIQNNDRNPTPSSTNPQGGFFDDNGNFISTIYGHPWIYSKAALENLLIADLKDEGQNNNNKTCNYSGDFCFMLFNGSGAPAATGVPFIPGGAIVIYFPDSSVADDCFAYHVFDRTDNSVKIGTITTGCNS